MNEVKIKTFKSLTMSCKTKFLTVRKPKPVVIKKNSIKPTIYKEDMIYESSKGDFLNLEYDCKIINRQNISSKENVMVCRYLGIPIVKTSEQVASVIGQKNYEKVFSAISSVFNHELKVQALYALLTVPKKTNTVACQTESQTESNEKKSDREKIFVDSGCQTIETSVIMFNNKRSVKKRKVTPYVVTETKKEFKRRVVVNPGPLLALPSKPDQVSGPVDSDCSERELPILNFDENSNDSEGKLSTITSLSVNTLPGLYNNPLGLIVDNLNKVTVPESKPKDIDWSNSTTLTLPDRTVLTVPCKIEDDFHVATVEILKMVPMEHRKKLFCYQIYLDWKHALTRDEENFLPLHLAAINGDDDLVRRQCSVLRSRKESVDLLTADGMQMAVLSVRERATEKGDSVLPDEIQPLRGRGEEGVLDLRCHHSLSETAQCYFTPPVFFEAVVSPRPLHLAALNGDDDLVRRQCSVLRSRKESVDLLTADGMTALQISIYRNYPMCTKILLFFGADPLFTDDDYRTCFHLAAEADPAHLEGLVKYCYWNPMKILRENHEMWKPELEFKPKDYLTKYLLRKISVMFDSQGYTPLMLACKLGKFENVRILVEAAPDTINTQAPGSGNTALYIAVSSACLFNASRGPKSKVSDEFRKTIEFLVEHGADPAIDNHSGSSVNTVLQDLHISELSMIIANKMTAKNCNDTDPFKACILIKDKDGNITKMPAKTEEIDTKTNIMPAKTEEIDTKTNITNTLPQAEPDNFLDLRIIRKPWPKKKILCTQKIIKIKRFNTEKPTSLREIIKVESPEKRSETNTEFDNILKERKPEKRNTDNDTIAKDEFINIQTGKRFKFAHEMQSNQSSESDYMATFKNFLTDVDEDKITSPLLISDPVPVQQKLCTDSDGLSTLNFGESSKTVLVTKTGRGSNTKLLEEVKKTLADKMNTFGDTGILESDNTGMTIHIPNDNEEFVTLAKETLPCKRNIFGTLDKDNTGVILHTTDGNEEFDRLTTESNKQLDKLDNNSLK